jgi:hypothetical protein
MNRYHRSFNGMPFVFSADDGQGPNPFPLIGDQRSNPATAFLVSDDSVGDDHAR